MNTALRKFLAWTLLACLPLFASGCGGGGGGGEVNVPMTTISGVAMKGPIKGAWVGVYQLKSDGNAGDLLGSGISGVDGKYAIPIPTSRAGGPLLIVVKGQNGATYVSESQTKDVNFTSAESFRAVVDAADASQGVAVTPLTEAAYQKLQQVLTVNSSLAVDSRVISATNKQIATLFNVSNILADPSTDPAYLAALRVIDQMVVGANTSNTLAAMNIINQALVNADVASPNYQVFQQALTTAATVVVNAAPTLSPAVQALLAQVANPPAQPVLTDTTPPTAPGNLTATASALTATTSSVALAWSPSAPGGLNAVSGYDVYRDNSKVATVKTPGYIDSSVVPNVTYTYYVIAFDAAGNRSAASNQVSVKPLPANLGVTVNGQLSSGILGLPQLDIVAPTAPSNLTASTSAVTSTTSSVALSWSPSTDNIAVTGYEVYRNGSKIATVSLPAYTDPTVTSNVTYTYYVKAFDVAGNRSPASNQLPVTPPPASLGVTVNGQVSS